MCTVQCALVLWQDTALPKSHKRPLYRTPAHIAVQTQLLNVDAIEKSVLKLGLDLIIIIPKSFKAAFKSCHLSFLAS